MVDSLTFLQCDLIGLILKKSSLNISVTSWATLKSQFLSKNCFDYQLWGSFWETFGQLFSNIWSQYLRD